MGCCDRLGVCVSLERELAAHVHNCLANALSRGLPGVADDFATLLREVLLAPHLARLAFATADKFRKMVKCLRKLTFDAPTRGEFVR